MAGLRTSDGVSESVTAGMVLWSIIMFGLIYLLLFCVWIYVFDSKIRHGPDDHVEVSPPDEHGFLKTAAVMAGGEHSLTEADTEGGA
jgi:cytochrome d ubiquinol oxidase subunit I